MNCRRRAAPVIVALTVFALLAGATPASAVDGKTETRYLIFGDIPLNADGSVDRAVLEHSASEQDATVAAILSGSETDPAAAQAMVSVVEDDASINATSPAYGIQRTWQDNRAAWRALRLGTSTWGWTHAKRHNVSMAIIIKTTQFPRSRVASGDQTVSVTPAREFVCGPFGCWVTRSMDVRLVHDNRILGDRWPKGVITTYCVGPSVCPSWVVASAA